MCGANGGCVQCQVSSCTWPSCGSLISPCSDILYIKAAHHVHSIAMEQGQWTRAATTGEIALSGFKKYYGERAGLVAVLLVR